MDVGAERHVRQFQGEVAEADFQRELGYLDAAATCHHGAHARGGYLEQRMGAVEINAEGDIVELIEMQ